MDVHLDAIGNLIGILHGLEEKPPVVVGSHIDTVENGGKLDGLLGVVAGLEVASVHADLGKTPKRPIWVVAFANEEGVRFQPDLMGSAVFSGWLDLEDALGSRDSNSVTVGEELERLGVTCSSDLLKTPVRAFLELHIEQGPVLDAEGLSIGVVTGVQGFKWLEVVIEGETNHAGTAPMGFRKDASLGAAWLINRVRELTEEIEGLVGNVGDVSFHPGNINVVPGRIVAKVDLRHPDQCTLDAVVTDVSNDVRNECARISLTADVSVISEGRVTTFDADLVDRVERAARVMNLSMRRMVSGASHDAQMMATAAPTAMIFVPSEKGISHNAKESTREEHIRDGANLLLRVIDDIVNAPDPELVISAAPAKTM